MMLKLLESRKTELTQRIVQFRGFIREIELDLEETEELLASYAGTKPVPTTVDGWDRLKTMQNKVADHFTTMPAQELLEVVTGASAAAEVEGATPKRGRGRPPKAATAPAPAPEPEPAPPADDEDEDDNSDPGEPPTFNADGSPF